MLKLNSKTLIYIGVFVYIICLLSLIPAVGVMKKWANNAQLSIDSFSGDVWQGNASVHILGPSAAQWQNTQVSWKLNPWHLLAGGLGFDVELKNPNFVLQGTVVTGVRRVVVRHLNGHASGPWLSYFIRSQRLFFSQNIQLKDILVDVNYRSRRVSSAEGSVTWPGGVFNYPAGENERSVIFPPFVGKLDTAKGALQIMISEAKNQGKVIELQIFGTGKSRVIFFKRLLQIVNRLNATAPSDEPYLTVEQNVF